MEIFLNLVWAALAVAIVVHWHRTGSHSGHSRRAQLVAIAVLVAILFPVISVSDDLMAVQVTSETDSAYRRSHLAPTNAHPLMSAAGYVPPQAFTGIVFGTVGFVSPARLAIRVHDDPALASIQNRPPPFAA